MALRRATKELWTPILGGLPETVTADADGKFEITGVGRGRLLGVTVSGAGIESAGCRIVTDPAFDPRPLKPLTGRGMYGPRLNLPPDLYGPTFTQPASPPS